MSGIDGGAPRPSVFLVISYDGEPFHGFQRQEGLETVQGCLEAALATVLRRQVTISGAGRTDSGVHALGQVVSFEHDSSDPDLETIRRSVSALAAPAIAVREAWLAHPGSDARFSASGREYRYRIVNSRVPPVALRHVAWWVKHPLDTNRMRQAAAHLVGKHDFASFCVTQSSREKHTVRTLLDIGFEEVNEVGEDCLIVRIVGPAFLHSMIRIIVGTLVEVGKGRRNPDEMERLLAARERAAAGQTAPAHGLTFHAVTYPPDIRIVQTD